MYRGTPSADKRHDMTARRTRGAVSWLLATHCSHSWYPPPPPPPPLFPLCRALTAYTPSQPTHPCTTAFKQPATPDNIQTNHKAHQLWLLLPRPPCSKRSSSRHSILLLLLCASCCKCVHLLLACCCKLVQSSAVLLANSACCSLKGAVKDMQTGGKCDSSVRDVCGCCL